MQMAFVGRLHPLLIHFPIALALAAAAAEGMAILVHDGRWHTMAVGNVRAAAVLAVMAAVAGWRMATASGIETSTVLEWHRWIGTMGAGSTVAAAFATIWRDRRSPLALSIYQSRCSPRPRWWAPPGISAAYRMGRRLSALLTEACVARTDSGQGTGDKGRGTGSKDDQRTSIDAIF